jgi:hypothetical protein
MSASQETSRAIGVAFTPSDGPRDPHRVAEVVLAFLETAALKHRSMTVLQEKSSRPRFSAKALRTAFNDVSTREVWLWTDNVYDGAEVRCFLRPHHPEDQTYELRFLSVVSNRLPVQMTSALRQLMESFVEQYPMVHGGIGGYRTARYASEECSFSGAAREGDIDAATTKRLGEDQMLYNVSKRLLRRLYPITIIGPELWAKLPPRPETSTPATVEDLGNCKMLTCWPELVEPHDPAFLAGTAELRRWIWPYTIQNPADDPDVVDAKLGLRPVNSS